MDLKWLTTIFPLAFFWERIRQMFIHYFFKNRTGVVYEEALPLIEETLDREKPRHC